MAGQYTRTGNGWLQKTANWLSYIPFVGGVISWPLGMIDTGLESLGWLFRGKFMSAATTLAAGLVGNTVNAAGTVFDWIGLGGAFGWLSKGIGGIFGGMLFNRWSVNVVSGLASGHSLGTNARALTENIIGGVTGAIGMKPTVLRSYTAGVGYTGGRAQPGYWATRAAQERGQDPYARYAAYRSGEGYDHVAALESAAGQGNYRGM